MGNSRDQIRWHKSGNDQWTSREERSYTGTIDFVAGPDPYTLTINPGAVVSSWPTLRNAKNAFRKYLLDKPVQ